jgi:hypothetical protein
LRFSKRRPWFMNGAVFLVAVIEPCWLLHNRCPHTKLL